MKIVLLSLILSNINNAVSFPQDIIGRIPNWHLISTIRASELLSFWFCSILSRWINI